MPRSLLLSSLTLLALAAAAAADELPNAKPRNVSYKQAAEKVDMFLNKELATTYLFGPDQARPLFYPVLAPGGIPVTRGWPLDKSNKNDSTDHPHQQSLWFCHGDVIAEGHKPQIKIGGVDGVDFWSVRPGAGTIRQKQIVFVSVGVGFQTENIWTENDKTILTDRRFTTFKEAPGGWVLDMRITLKAAQPLIFGDTKEGALALRVSEQMRADKVGTGQIRMPDGKKGEKDCWGQQAGWCDYSGKVDGKAVGITIFADPKNPAPTCYHVRGYGLFAANPFGRKKAAFPGAKDRTALLKLGQGEELQLHYAVHVYAGERTEEMIADLAKGVWMLR